MRYDDSMPVWGKVALGGLAVLTVGWMVHSLHPVALSAEQLESLDISERRHDWARSPAASTFQKLQTAGEAVHPDGDAIADTLKILSNTRAAPQDVARATAEGNRLLTKHRASLDTVVRNLDAPLSTPPIPDEDTLLPHLADFRTLARLFAIESYIARRAGYSDDAVRSALHGMRFGAQVLQDTQLLPRMVGYGIQAISRRALMQMLSTLNAQQARQLTTALLKINKRTPPLSATFASEARFSQRLMLKTMGDHRFGGKFDGDLPLFAAFIWSRQSTFDNFTRYVKTWQSNADGPYKGKKDAPPSAPRDLIGKNLLLIFANARFKYLTERTQSNMLVTRAAIRAYEAEHGNVPDTLDALVPGYLPSLPQDPFDGNRPLKLNYGPDGTRLYSVGPDGLDNLGQTITNTQNNDGKPASDSEKRATLAHSKGDIVSGINP